MAVRAVIYPAEGMCLAWSSSCFHWAMALFSQVKTAPPRWPWRIWPCSEQFPTAPFSIQVMPSQPSMLCSWRPIPRYFQGNTDSDKMLLSFATSLVLMVEVFPSFSRHEGHDIHYRKLDYGIPFKNRTISQKKVLKPVEHEHIQRQTVRGTPSPIRWPGARRA